MAIIDKTDLPSAVQANEMVDVMVAGANATAARVAPCLVTTTAPTADQLAEAKLVLIGMVQRWTEAGSGALQQQAAGPFSQSVDTRQRTGFNPWPSEIQRLQQICATPEKSGAFAVDTAPSLSGMHADWCSALTYTDASGGVVYGGAYCTCGADIAGYPIYEPA